MLVVVSVFTLVATRRLSLVDSTSQDTLALLQALFSAQLAILALIATGLSVVVQLRSASFGSDVLFDLIRGRWLITSGVVVVISIMLSGALLGNWRSLSEPWTGLIPDIAVLLAVISTCAIAVAFVASSSRLMNDEAVAQHIASMTQRDKWRDQIQASVEPQPLRWLLEALMAARSKGDIRLFRRLLITWTRQILGSPPFTRIRQEAGAVELSGKDADYIVALDHAHQELFLALSLGSDASREFRRLFEKLAELAFPAFSTERDNHLQPPQPKAPIRPVSYQTVVPGLLTLGEMTSSAIAQEDYEFAAILIRQYWGPAAAAAISVTERIVDPKDYNTSDRVLLDSIRYILKSYVEMASGFKAVKEAVSVALLTTLAVAKTDRVLSRFVSEFANETHTVSLADSFGDELYRPWMWQKLLSVANKEHAPIVNLCYIARAAVESANEPSRFLLIRWVLDDILLFLHGVLRGINRIETWQFMEDSMVEWLWKFLEDHHVRKPTKLLRVSQLDEGPYFPGFKERYELSLEVLSKSGQDKLSALHDEFLAHRDGS